VTKAKPGDKVKIEFVGKTADGQVFSPRDDGPVEFTVGQNEVIEGIDQGVVDMEVGETRTIELGPEQAFGNYSERLVTELDRGSIPPEQKVEEGQHLELHRADGQTLPAIVLSVTDEAVMIDANHPLAGRDLVFEVKLLEIK
jgi:FKBP-type peptidyl-prolyl cis-trans isomerase 2